MEDQLVSTMVQLSLQTAPTVETRAPFRLFDLPPEIRLKIYSLVLFAPKEEHLVRKIYRFPLQRIHLLLVSRRFHDDAAPYLYSSIKFRLFPLQHLGPPPSLVATAPKYRCLIRSLGLVLGSSWTKPPRSWRVNAKLGLEQMVRVHTLEIFVECDPSHPVFEGFRVSQGFYTNFAGKLLRDTLSGLPSLEWVVFDANPSVERKGDLLTRLASEVHRSRKKIIWSSTRNWDV
jgi:hypothetical protein